MEMRITTTRPILDASRTPGQLSIRQPKADVSIRMNHAQLRMESTPAKLLIDQSQCFAESGLMSVCQLSFDNSSYSRQKCLEAIGKIADQGDELAAIESGSDPLPEQAYYNSTGQFLREWNMVTMPMSRPKIDVIEGTLDIEVEGGKPEIDIRANPVEISYTPGKFEIYMKQRNSMDIQWVESKLDVKV